jgi:hypothetical protein
LAPVQISSSTWKARGPKKALSKSVVVERDGNPNLPGSKKDQPSLVETAETEEETRPVAFAHPSEEEFAKILDFYGVRWLYEPHSFPLRWNGDRVIEMFTPDFYLLDLDLYVELTTMKQSLVTKKNRKLRRLRALYPHINIKLFYKKDYRQLAAKYGLHPKE